MITEPAVTEEAAWLKTNSHWGGYLATEPTVIKLITPSRSVLLQERSLVNVIFYRVTAKTIMHYCYLLPLVQNLRSVTHSCYMLPHYPRCYCEDGYTGRNCEKDWDECWNSPCLNGGKILSYSVTLLQGYKVQTVKHRNFQVTVVTVYCFRGPCSSIYRMPKFPVTCFVCSSN